MPDIRICGNVAELNHRVAEATAGAIVGAVRRRGRCSVVLSGGNTPRALYTHLASQYREQIPWADVHMFWGDERYVPASDPDSNYRMALDTLLAHVPCPDDHVHPMPVSTTPADAAASEYERTIRSHFPGEECDFDLVFLGLGEDGHTASLFPGSPAVTETRRWVTAVQVAAKPPVRLTMTLPRLTRAANIFVLAVGAKKAQALHDVVRDDADPRALPAAGLFSSKGTLTWWVDEEAAARLTD